MSRIKKSFFIAISALCISLLIACKDDDKTKSNNKASLVTQSQNIEPKEVNVYSTRLPDLVKPIFDAFTKETGIKVNFIFLKQGALERLKSEGEFTPADLILVADIGSIHDIVDANLVIPIKSKIIEQNIPTQYRSTDNLWVGLTGRIRMIARTTNKLPFEIHGYDAFSNQKFKGRVCSRSFTHPYNISLVASYLQINGLEKTKKWLQSFNDNLFDKPSGDDTGQIDLIATGLCDIAPVNHYYYERMIHSNKELSKKVKLVPLKDMTDGAYSNVSGAMISKYSENYQNAVKLVEYMTQEKAQKIFAEYDYEFPLNKHLVSKSDLLKEGMDNIAKISLDDIAKKRSSALDLIYKIQ